MTLIVSGNRDAFAFRSVWQYDLDLAFQLGVDVNATQWGAAIDADGNFTVVGDRVGSPTRTTRRYNSAGTLQQSVDFGSEVLCVATDAAGNVYTGGAVNAGLVTTRKHTSSLGTTWSVNHGARVRAIAVDASGNVYTGGDRTGNLTTRKYDSSGTLLWSADHGAAVYGIAVDASGNVYTVGVLTGGATTRKYASDGTAITTGWPVSHGAATNGVAVDADSNVYTAGDRISNLTTRKYNSAGTLQWSADHGASTYAVKVAGSAIFVGGARTAADPRRTVRKYSSSGSELASVDIANTTIRGMAVLLGDLVTTIPGLPLPFALGMPFPTAYLTIPGLPLPFALGIPESIQPGPIERPALATRVIYRLVLAGLTSNPVIYPLIGLQCNRRVGASTWMVAEIGVSDAGMEAIIAAHVGQEMLIQSGYGLSDGSEDIGPFLRATITDYQVTDTPYGLALAVTGRVINPPFSATTRVLAGVTRIQTNQGRRTVYCAAVDPLLRPNDTVVVGSETFTVGIIAYRIDPERAEMTVTEVA